MADPYVRETGRTEDMDGIALAVGVDYDAVSLGHGHHTGPVWRLTQAQAEEFAHLFVAACWEAGQNARRMAEAGDG